MSKLEVDVGIRNSPFKNGLDQMRSQAQAWGSDIKNTIAGAFAFGAVASFFTSFVSGMARVQDLADRLGESTSTIQRVGNAAKLSGSDLESIVKNLTNLSLAAADSADKFEKVGINAAAFVNAGTEEKLLMLARAYEEASGSQEKMAALMDLLGGKGQDMMILLSAGVEELNKQLNEVPVVADVAVKAMANLDDAIDSFTQYAHQSLGSVVGLLQHLGAATVAVGKMLTEGGSFSGNYQKIIEGAGLLDQTPTGGNTGKKRDFTETTDDAKKAADEQKKTAEAIAALDQEMLDLARSRMTEEQKITDYRREQAQFAAIAQDKTKSDADRATAAKRVLEIQQQIEAGEKAIAEKKQQEADKAADKAKKQAEDIAKAETSVAEEEERQRLAKMDPKARIAELKKQQKELQEAARNDPDRKSAAEKKLEALKLNDQIDAAQKELDSTKEKKELDSTKEKTARPSVVSSSLAAIGGGGGAYVTNGDPLLNENRRQTTLLQQIAQNTRSSPSAMAAANPF